MRDAGHRTPDAGHRTSVAGHRTAKKAKIIYPPPRGVDIIHTKFSDINNVECHINIEIYYRYKYGVFHANKGQHLKNTLVFMLFLSTFTYR